MQAVWNRLSRLNLKRKREEMGEEEWQRAKEERQERQRPRWTQKEVDLLIKVSHPV